MRKRFFGGSLWIILCVLIFNSSLAAGETADLFAAGHRARQWGDYPKAFELFRQAQTAAEKADNQAAAARALTAQGSLYFLQSKPVAAVKIYRQALEIARRVADKTEEARALAGLGQVYWRLYKYDNAVEYCQRAERLAAVVGNKEIQAAALRFLGRTYNGIYKEDYNQKALVVLEQSRRLAIEAGDEEGELAALKEIGVIYQTSGNAEIWWGKSLEVYRKLILRLENSPYRRLLAVVRHNSASCLFALLHLQFPQKQPESAEKYREAFELASRAAAVFEEIGDREELNEIYNEISIVDTALDDYENAFQYNSKAIAAGEQMRRDGSRYAPDEARYFEGLVNAFQLREKMFLEQKRTGEAFLVNDAFRARTLLESWRRGRVDLQNVLTDEETERQQAVNAELTGLNRRLFAARYAAKPDKTKIAELKNAIAEARLTLEDFENETLAAHPELTALTAPPAPIDLSGAVDLLTEDTAIIEFSYFLGNRFGFYVLTRGETNALDVDAPGVKIHAQQINAANNQTATLRHYAFECVNQNSTCEAFLAARDFAAQVASHSLDYKPNAQKLYEMLIKPVLSQIAGKRRLIIVPDGNSWTVPFAALMNADGRFLIEDFSLSYAPSLAALREMRRLNDERQNYIYKGELLALGNPTLSTRLLSDVRGEYDDGNLQPLPDATREVKNLAKIYPANSKILIGKQAGENALKTEAGNYRFIHLAAHGISNRANPMYSHVLLATGGGEDGQLEAWEVSRLKLNAEMVVLSACETAGGRVSSGEGAIGMSWAFFVAGTPTTTASLWKVDSTSTAELMTNFHLQLQSRAAPGKAEALRRAALETLRNNKTHPFFWASFILLGDER